MENNYIYTYIRDKKNQKRGIVLAAQNKGRVSIGYSICCKEDKWDKDLGISIALGRALAGIKRIAPRVKERVEFLLNSASRRKAFEGLEVPSIDEFTFETKKRS